MRSKPSLAEERYYDIEANVHQWFRHPGDPDAEAFLRETCNRPFLVNTAIDIAKREYGVYPEYATFKQMLTAE